MRIPDDAIIPASKLTDYLLVPRPWDDKSKFLQQAGFISDNPQALEAAIRRLANDEEAIEDGENDYGTFFRVVGPITGPNGMSLRVVLHLVTMESRQDHSFCDIETREDEGMSKFKLYERVALARDIEEHGLKRGDVATFVDTVPHPSGGPEGMVLEVSNALGDSLQVIVVTVADVEPLQADEILAIRHLVNVA